MLSAHLYISVKNRLVYVAISSAPQARQQLFFFKKQSKCYVLYGTYLLYYTPEVHLLDIALKLPFACTE